MKDQKPIFDSNGVEIKAGDILECPEYPEYHACRYHACFLAQYGKRVELEIRDLGCSNVGMYDLADHYNIGHYSKHLDKLSDDDLSCYWNTTREEASKLKGD